MNLRLYAAAAAILFGSLTAYADTFPDTFPTYNVNGFFQDGSAFGGTLVVDPRNNQVFYVHIRTGKKEGDFDTYYPIYDQTLPGGNFSIDIIDDPGATFREFSFYLPVSTLAQYNGSALCSLSFACGNAGTHPAWTLRTGCPHTTRSNQEASRPRSPPP